MALYPLFLELQSRSCLIIGGGEIASRKAAALLKCGAHVKVIAPELSSGLKKLAKAGRVSWRKRRFRPADLAGMELAVAATDDSAINRLASREARRRKIWINVVDQPELCTFILPAVVRRGRLVLAVSTGGASPALAKWIRKDLETRYGPEMGKLLAGAARARKNVLKSVPGLERRKQLFEKALKAYFDALRLP